MKLAWGASIAAQALLLLALLRAGRRDWWTAYLAADLARSAVLWPMQAAPSAYWYGWWLTSIAVAVVLVASVCEVTGRVRVREVIHIGIIAAGSVTTWAMLLTSDWWPPARRSPLLFEQALSLGCAGALLAPMAYGGLTDYRLASYLSARAAYSLVAQASALSVVYGTVYLGVIACGFTAWAMEILRGKSERIRS